MPRIPVTMATQHPDNASAPYWEKDGDSYVSTREEVQECYSAFADLGCEEFMWDWEGKYVDEAVAEKLFSNYFSYFKKHQLGADKFLIYRIPNIWAEGEHSLPRAFMTILTFRELALSLGFKKPPVFEVILPMTDSAEKIIHIQKQFRKFARAVAGVFKNGHQVFDYLRMRPLIEGTDELTAPGKILSAYANMHKKEFGPLEYLRADIARSDPALNSGLVPAVISAKIALSEYYRFEKNTGIKVYPAIGAGSLPFRGGLSPERLDNFMDEYSGTKTVYVQSGFRYDFPLPKVKQAIAKLNKHLPKTKPALYDKKLIEAGCELNGIFRSYYRKTVESLADHINNFARHIPARRERRLHIGLFGYSRLVGKKKLPRAIPFTAALYSLGIPPEFIATGRGLKEASRRGLLPQLEKIYLHLKDDLRFAGRFYNSENMDRLAKQDARWAEIKKDVAIVEDYLGEKLGPKTTAELICRNFTSSIYLLGRSGKNPAAEIIEAAKIRKSLG